MKGRHAAPERELGISRRELLRRTGLAGAGAAAAGLWVAPAAQADLPASLEWLLDRVAVPALRALTYDTYAGLSAFSLPGPDRYSLAQGRTSAAPGGVAARGPECVQLTLDRYLSLPDSYLQALVAAFRTGVSDVAIPGSLLGGVLAALELAGATLDDVIGRILQNDVAIPASLPGALLMNVAAVQVRPTSVVGLIPASPFANLRWAEKGQALQRIERADPDLVALLDGSAPEPLNESLSGLLRFLGNVFLALASFSNLSEFGVFDRAARVARRRPVGWNRTRYMPGRLTPADGWPEFIGYYQGRRAVATAPEYEGA